MKAKYNSILLFTPNITIPLLSIIFCVQLCNIGHSQQPFIGIWTTAPGESHVIIPTHPELNYLYDVYWEKISDTTVNGMDAGLTGNGVIPLPEPGQYRIEISGDFPAIFFYATYDPNNPTVNPGGSLGTIEQWGDNIWTTMDSAFYRNFIVIHATDTPDLSQVTSMAYMFYSGGYLGDVSQWDVSNVANMKGMFFNANATLSGIQGWNVSNVTNMSEMFYSTDFFNVDIGGWDVSSVTDMSGMFRFAIQFNRDIGSWDVSNVNDMSRMFDHAQSFNQNIGNWNVSSVTDMSQMFYSGDIIFLSYPIYVFNQDIGGWNVSNVMDMSGMFVSADSFNQNLSLWDVSNVTDMSSMFRGSIFNQSIGTWNVSNVMNMSMMFMATVFNQDISAWDVSSVFDMSYMFSFSMFDQAIGSWDVSGVNDMSGMFQDAVFNQDIGNWNVSAVTTMHRMFFSNLHFNQDIGGWDVSNVTDMSIMFAVSLFNQDIGGWDVSSVVNMRFMFSGEEEDEIFFIPFNQDISEWDVSNVDDMRGMFLFAESFDQDLGGWDISNVTNMIAMFSLSGMGTCNYDATLLGWALRTVRNGVIIGVHSLTYFQAADARQSLINDYGWTFDGDNLASEPCGLLPITGITFEDSTFIYDGTEKTLVIQGTLPPDATVVYEANTRTDAGVQLATATISAPGYETLVLNAELEILPAPITGISFEDTTFVYDGTEKILLISGTPPPGVSVTYENNTRTDPGSQIAIAQLTGTNYDTLTLYAYLSIDVVDGDADCDGVPDEDDLCPGGDDTVDNNGDGLPDCAYYPGFEFLPESWTCSPNNSTPKAYICHNHQTLCISESAVPAHLDHEGDYLGPCDAIVCLEERQRNQTVHDIRAPELTAYPNPASDELIVLISGEVVAGDRIFICDFTGIVIMSKSLTKNEKMVQFQLNSDRCHSGWYFVRLQSEEPYQPVKFTVVR